MNYKRITMPLGMLTIAGLAIVGGTLAYYSDTESSQGNVFAAGTVDLKVDHARQTYNGVDCQTCGLHVYSSTDTEVIGSNEAAANSDEEFPYSASKVEDPHENWADSDDYDPAEWIWEGSSTHPDDTENDAEYTFENSFQWNGAVEDIDFSMALAADNGYKIVLNDETIVDELDIEHNYENVFDLDTSEKDDFEDALRLGQNDLQITVRNHAGSSNPDANPAGLLFSLEITEENCDQGVDGFQEACMLWNETDLDDEHHSFWNFGDIKPGDWGTNVISFHIDDNDAYLCLASFEEDGESPHGENIADYINVFSFIDEDGDGNFDPQKDTGLGTSTLGDGFLTSLDPENEHHLSSTSTEYITLAWCAGEIEVDDDTGDISCDGSTVSDEAQGSSFGAEMVAYVEQVRNNLEFNCEDRLIEPTTNSTDSADQ